MSYASPREPLPEDGPEVTLRQLRFLAVAAPIIVVALLEIARVTTIGVTSTGSRVLLDGLVVAALVVVSTYMVRAVGRMRSCWRCTARGSTSPPSFPSTSS